MYYPWPTQACRKATLGADKLLVRLVTSFQTTQDDVDRFLALVRAK